MKPLQCFQWASVSVVTQQAKHTHTHVTVCVSCLEEVKCPRSLEEVDKKLHRVCQLEEWTTTSFILVIHPKAVFCTVFIFVLSYINVYRNNERSYHKASLFLGFSIWLQFVSYFVCFVYPQLNFQKIILQFSEPIHLFYF